MSLLHDNALATSIVVVLVVWVAGRFVAFCADRRRYQKLPGPPHSLIFGHLISIGKVAVKLPKRAHPQTLMTYLLREYDLPPVFYVDPRPVGIVSMVITDADAARQVVEADLPKHPVLPEAMEPFAGKVNMLTTSGPLWKKWRNAFNPGFSVQHLIGQVPAIVDCCQEFVRVLDEHASADRVFRMEEEATKITIDVIGKSICDHDFKSFTSGAQFITWMRTVLVWAIDHQSLNPLHGYNPIRPMINKYYRWKLTSYVGKILDERFSGRTSGDAIPAKGKTAIDLALEEYNKESSEPSSEGAPSMDAEFRKAAIDNLLILLFAGHDTTSSTLCYCYKLLSEHPDTLALARKELDDVFGVNVNAAEQLKEKPYLINKLEYSLAVIKEVLRLWAPASSVRLGRKDFFIRDPVSGDMLPTEGINVWTVSFAMGRSKKVWGEDADEFKPERFLSENIDSLPPDQWRPFEKGPRNCIGQAFALIEIKTVLALTLREFDVRSAFDELSSLTNDGTLWTKGGGFQTGPQEAFGDPMYQVLLATAKPREGMPVRVKRRKAF